MICQRQEIISTSAGKIICRRPEKADGRNPGDSICSEKFGWRRCSSIGSAGFTQFRHFRRHHPQKTIMDWQLENWRSWSNIGWDWLKRSDNENVDNTNQFINSFPWKLYNHYAGTGLDGSLTLILCQWQTMIWNFFLRIWAPNLNITLSPK